MLKGEQDNRIRLYSLNATATAVVASGSVLPPGEEIFDLMPPQSLPYPIWQLLLQTAAIVLAFWLLWLFYRWLTAPVQRPRAVLQQSPQKLAMRAIERLKLSPVWQQRQMKEICETVAAVLKTYAHDGCRIGLGVSSTSDEFLDSMAAAKVSGEIMKTAGEFLDICDRIKFAGKNDSEMTPEMLVDKLVLLVNHRGWPA